MNNIIKMTACLALLGLASLSSCNNSPFMVGDELVSSGKSDELKSVAYLPNRVYEIGYEERNGSFSGEKGETTFHVMLTNPSEEDVTIQLDLDNSEELRKKYSETRKTDYSQIPDGVLLLDKKKVTIKKGELRSEPITLTYGDRSLIEGEVSTFLTVVKIVGVSNSKIQLSKKQNMLAVSMLRKVLYTMPLSEGNIEGLTQVESSEIDASSTKHANPTVPDFIWELQDEAKSAFDNNPRSRFTTITRSFTVTWYNNMYLTAKLRQPITFAAYQMLMSQQGHDYQVKTLEVEVSKDGGQTWVQLGVQTFNMETYRPMDRPWEFLWREPEPIVRLYKPIEGVNAIRWHILDVKERKGTAAIAELKLFKK